MAKRKELSEENAPNGDADESSSDEDMDTVNVDFEWFDPQPAIDFHGLKTLLRQLFDVDNQLFDLSELVDLILSQPKLGSTVKVEGNESDPFAFLTILNLAQHKDKQVIKDLTSYILSKTAQTQSLQTLQQLLSPTSTAQVGLILTERLINMPSEITPPMYNFILEEMQWAIADNEPYNFSHYLILSKTYIEVASALDAEDDRPNKKRMKGNKKEKETFYFHPEDEALQKHALGWGGFEYTKQGDEGASDGRRAFQEMGIKPEGHAILIEAGKFADAVKAIGEYLGGQTG